MQTPDGLPMGDGEVDPLLGIAWRRFFASWRLICFNGNLFLLNNYVRVSRLLRFDIFNWTKVSTYLGFFFFRNPKTWAHAAEAGPALKNVHGQLLEASPRVNRPVERNALEHAEHHLRRRAHAAALEHVAAVRAALSVGDRHVEVVPRGR